MGLIRTAPDKRGPRAPEESCPKTAEVLRIVDAHLKTHEYLAGDAFTMGYIALGCGIWRWVALPIERQPLPNVQRWFDSLARRPAYKKIVMLPLS
jgi:glutathione S-transferase